MKKIFFIIISALLTFNINSQSYLEKDLRGYTNPEELISLSSNLPFDVAIDLISTISERLTGRKVTLATQRTEPIGVEIKNMQYEKALVIIVQYANLMLETRQDLILVKAKPKPDDTELTKDNYASVETREIKISAIFFEVDNNKAYSKGLNWKFLLQRKGLDLGLGFDPAASSEGGTTNISGFGVSAGGEFAAGGFFGEAMSVFQFFESENVGEIIASPTVTVRDRQSGRIQVGNDISIKQRDFAGNVIETFVSTGSIIEVTPYVYTEDGINYLLLNISVERSSGLPTVERTEIRKTTATTQVLMLDGEETVIGGLMSTEESYERSGIPILKDLPWWVLGIRYLTGSDVKTIAKKELVIIIRAELLPTLKERVAGIKKNNNLQEELEHGRNRIKIHQFNTNNNDN